MRTPSLPIRRAQAKDIAMESLLAEIRRLVTLTGLPANRWDVAKKYVVQGIPEKVVNAKLTKLVKRKFLDGCDGRHNCRGDFMLTKEGDIVLEALAELRAEIAARGLRTED